MGTLSFSYGTYLQVYLLDFQNFGTAKINTIRYVLSTNKILFSSVYSTFVTINNNGTMEISNKWSLESPSSFTLNNYGSLLFSSTGSMSFTNGTLRNYGTLSVSTPK